MMHVAFIASLFMQDAPAPDAAQRSVAELVARIDRKMGEMAARLRESEPEQAARLECARALLKDPATFLPGKLEKVLEELGRSNFGNAASAGEDVAVVLKAILDVLEGRVEPRDRAKEIDGYRALLEKIKARRTAEESVLRDTRDRKDADATARRQREIRELTEEIRPADDDVAEPLKRASEAMEDAERDLKAGRRGDAQKAEEDAIEQFKRAEEAVEKRISDLKRGAAEEAMLDVREAVRRALEIQRSINAGTRSVDAVRRERGSLTRAEQQRLRGELAPAQENAATDLGATVALLAAEDVEVFRQAVSSAVNEMQESAAALAQADSGARTQSIQGSIIKTLETLLEAFDVRGRPSAYAPSDGAPGKPPLVPDLAQLNLMRTLQQQLLRRTEAAASAFASTPVDRARLKRLTDEQDELSRIMGRFIRRFENRR